MNNRLKPILLLLSLLLVACGSTVAQGDDGFGPTPTPLPTPIVPERPTYVVEQGSVSDLLEFTGRVSPVQEQELFFKSDGFVATVNVARGDRVEAGDLLAELELDDLQAELAQAELALQTAEINLLKAEQDLADQIIEAQIALEKAQLEISRAQLNDSEEGTAALLRAEISLARAQEYVGQVAYEYQKVLDRPWEPEEVVNSIREQLETAEEELLLAQAEYSDALRGGGVDDSAITAQISARDLRLAELALEKLQRGIDPLLALEVERAQLDIDDVEQRIGEARLVAPFAGEVLSLGIRSGDSATAFETVVVLADTEALEITASLSNEQMEKMSIDQPATIVLRNRPEEVLQARVRQLPYPYGGGTVDANDGDTAVRLELLGEPDLRLGELASVTIVLQEKENVLWLPPAALRTFQGRTFVVVQEGDGQRRVDVTVGIESETRVEILDGVAAGEVIVGE